MRMARAGLDARGVGLGEVVRVGGTAVAHDLAVDAGAAGARVLELLEHHDPSPSPITKPSRPASKGRLAVCGSSLRCEMARIA